MMKKIFCLLLLTGYSANVSAAMTAVAMVGSHVAVATVHFVINLSGTDVMFRYYEDDVHFKNKHADDKDGKNERVESFNIFGPLLVGGKKPDDFLAGITAAILPPPANFHELTANKIRINAVNIHDRNAIDTKIDGCSMPAPELGVPYDFLVTREGNQLVVKKRNTVAGIPVPGTGHARDINQWPSVEEMKIFNLPESDQIAALQQQNISLQADIATKQNQIKKLKGHRPDVESKKKNRSDDINNDNDTINANNQRIAILQGRIAEAARQAILKKADIVTNAPVVDKVLDVSLVNAVAAVPVA